MLDPDPQTRIGSSADDAKEIVNHPFFAGINWDALTERQLDAPYLPEKKPDESDYNGDDADQQVQSDIKAQDAFEQMPESQIQYIKENAEAFSGF